MRTLKLLALDVSLCALLFIVGAFVGGAYTAAGFGSGCRTCGSTVGLTVWTITALALQPVLWARALPRGKRGAIWVVAVFLGLLVYLITESAAGALLKEGRFVGAIGVGFVANSLGALAALLFSRGAVRRASLQGARSEGSSTSPRVPLPKSTLPRAWWRVTLAFGWLRLFVVAWALLAGWLGYRAYSYKQASRSYQQSFRMRVEAGTKYDDMRARQTLGEFVSEDALELQMGTFQMWKDAEVESELELARLSGASHQLMLWGLLAPPLSALAVLWIAAGFRQKGTDG